MKPTPKSILAIAPISKTNGATATGQIDTLGYDWLSLAVIMTTGDVVSNKPSVLKISESDDTTTTVTDVTALVGGGTGGFTIPNADTSNSQLVRFDIDLKKRKRYLTLTVVPRTTQTIVALANLHIGETEPTDATGSGVTTLVAN